MTELRRFHCADKRSLKTSSTSSQSSHRGLTRPASRPSQTCLAVKGDHTTESLLLHLTEVWKEALDDGLKVGVLFIDFRKAFDCVDHVILGEKLKALGVSEDMWIWLMDYLANRSQLTQIDGAFSESKPVKIGVPHGSLLGPRLFITYTHITTEQADDYGQNTPVKATQEEVPHE